MLQSKHYDVLVLGSGESGKYMAWTLGQAGQHTAVVERRLIGGSCPNIACLPSKNIIHSAKAASLVRRGDEFGIKTESFSINMEAVRERKRKMVQALVDVHLDSFRQTGVDLVLGDGRFVAPKTIDVRLQNGEMQRLTGDRIFINVGTRAAIPNVSGLSSAKPLTHVEALELGHIPEHLVVLGGGYVGLELAQAIRRFGASVTVIDRGRQLAHREDPDVGEALLQLFRDEGINVLLKSQLVAVEGISGERIRLQVRDTNGECSMDATDLLIAAGRTPNTQGIGLKAAGVDLDAHGFVMVNERLETSAPDTWAMGDCAGSPFFTHVAFDDFRVVRDNLKGGNRTTHDRLIPFCMFTDPELVRVGLNESEAAARGIDYRVFQIPMKSVARTRTLSEPRGFMKALVGGHTDQVIGFTAFGAEASELLSVVQTAMLASLPFTALRDAIYTHPTITEGLGVLFTTTPSMKQSRAAA